MYQDRKICVVVPCYCEETQIGKVITTMPDFVDKIVVIDDASPDSTSEVVKSYLPNNPRLVLLRHQTNQGVGGAIATGYEWARDNNYDVACVMAGDAQMDPADLPAILDPVVNGEADYTKGNRLFTAESFRKIPKVRYFGNSILSLLTKIASGYWHIADSQSGYTAINRRGLEFVQWPLMYKRYGQPNDLLVRLNVFNLKVRDVMIKPVYNVGEKSGIRLWKVVPRVSLLLLKLFLWRIKEKYIIRDFHPLVFFYFFGFVFSLFSVLLFGRVFYFWWILGEPIPPINALAAMFSFVSATQFVLFAMWFDMEINKDLK